MMLHQIVAKHIRHLGALNKYILFNECVYIKFCKRNLDKGITKNVPVFSAFSDGSWLYFQDKTIQNDIL